MKNERELWLEEIMARMREGRDLAAPRPRHPKRRPNCPDQADLMNVALERAPAEVVRRVEEHAKGCDYCTACLEAYRNARRGAPLPEPEFEGSLLEEIADPLVPVTVDRVDTGGTEVPEPSVKGTLLERPAERREFVPKKPPVPIGDVSSEGYTPGTVTRCAQVVLQRPELWPSMAKELRPWLAAILRRAGADCERVDALLSFIRERLFATPPQETYRSLVLDWVWEFLAASRPEPNNETLIEQAALDQVLQQAGEDDPPEARLFRKEALLRALPSSRALLQFAPEAVARASWLPTFRLQLFYEAEKLKVKGLQFFQWN